MNNISKIFILTHPFWFDFTLSDVPNGPIVPIIKPYHDRFFYDDPNFSIAKLYRVFGQRYAEFTRLANENNAVLIFISPTTPVSSWRALRSTVDIDRRWYPFIHIFLQRMRKRINDEDMSSRIKEASCRDRETAKKFLDILESKELKEDLFCKLKVLSVPFVRCMSFWKECFGRRLLVGRVSDSQIINFSLVESIFSKRGITLSSTPQVVIGGEMHECCVARCSDAATCYFSLTRGYRFSTTLVDDFNSLKLWLSETSNVGGVVTCRNVGDHFNNCKHRLLKCV